MNPSCNGVGACGWPARDRTPAAPSGNPGIVGQCTERASSYFKMMSGGHPNWGGDAHLWDDNARATGWTVGSWPRPDTIVVWQQNMGGVGRFGHVGYVSDVRVNADATIDMRIFDRNFDGRGGDRDGAWTRFVPGMKFIAAPPRSF